MNKKNLNYEKYYTKLNKTLKNFNNHFLFHIPDLYKKDLRKDKISIIKIKFSFFKSLIRSSCLYENIEKIKKAKMCFISHYVGNKIKDKDYDFYYGNLFKKLKKDDSYYVILINHTNESLTEIKKQFKNSNITRVYVNNDFNIFSDSFNILKITKEYLKFKILKFINYKKFKFSNKLNLEFNYKYFLSSRYTFKITNSIIDILDKSKNLDNLVCTFEGHAFEKIIFNYCKKKNIKSFGYFFSVIREYKNSIYYKFNLSYEPDIILTSGVVSKNDLRLNSPHKVIKILGSNKDSITKKKFNIQKNKKKYFLTILVCPEGLFSETNQLLKLINNNLLFKKNLRFIFRTHPLINIFSDFQKDHIYRNIIFSKEKNIQNDFNKSDIILYSGSSVCIQAVMNGLVPINFNNYKNNFSLDPLYKVNNFIIQDSLMLLNLINSIYKNKYSLRFQKKLNKIQTYSESYFKKLDQDILLKNIIKNK